MHTENLRAGEEASSTSPSRSEHSPARSRSPSHLFANPHAPLNPSTLREAHTLSASPSDSPDRERGRMAFGKRKDSSSSSSSSSDDDEHSAANRMKATLGLAKPAEPSVADRLKDTFGGHAPVEEPSIADRLKATFGGAQPVEEQSTTSRLKATFADALSAEPEQDKRPQSPPKTKAKRNWFGRKLGAVESETTSLLRRVQPLEIEHRHAHEGPCNHGTFSPTLESSGASIMSDGSESRHSRGGFFSSFPGRSSSGRSGRQSTTARLAEEHGIQTSPAMYLTYYVPFFAWIQQYKWAYLRGDLIAAITVASFYIPMALSLAANLGHIPPINGLYSFVFNPLIYAFLGSCPQMVVGPEAAGSLLVGSVVRSSLENGSIDDDDGAAQAMIAGLVTGMAGAIIFIAGITRLGFLENVLSRPFMRGFISSVGFIILIDQLIVEMGLGAVAERVGGVAHGSSVDKITFLFQHYSEAHKLTTVVAFSSIAIIMTFREMKKRLQPRYPSVAYIPDRFLVVVFSAILCYQFSWEKHGLEVLGEVKSTTGGNPFPFSWPFQMKYAKLIREAMGTSFVIALLGFFESSVAAKNLGTGETQEGDGIQGINLSPNRELVALGVANLVGGCFNALPGFGGYGRSKVNASTGAKTPMSSIFLSMITVICILFLLPYFYYLPKAVLSSMITVVAYSLIEEAPHDISFFLRISAFPELFLMLIIFLSTIFYSLTLGIATGIGLSLLSVIRHATRPRIQILGRKPHTNRFESAEAENQDAQGLEFVEGCLIVKIPEPLTFANTGDLKNRLRRLERYGTTAAHPALPRVRQEHHNRNVIFDIHGVTGLDGSGAQVLAEIVEGYMSRGVRVFFSRGPTEGKVWESLVKSGIIESIGGVEHYVGDVEEALRLTEMEEVVREP